MPIGDEDIEHLVPAKAGPPTYLPEFTEAQLAKIAELKADITAIKTRTAEIKRRNEQLLREKRLLEDEIARLKSKQRRLLGW